MSQNSDLDTAIFLARGASAILMGHYKPNIATERKADNSIVTAADKEANRYIVSQLHRRYPLDSIVSEEDGGRHIIGSSDSTWFVDPCDGTSRFTQHNDEFAVHIGKTILGQPTLGVVHKPVGGKTYYGSAEKGAFVIYGKDTYPISVIGKKQNVMSCHSKLTLSIKGQELLERLKIEDVEITGSEGLRIMRFATGQASLYLGNITRRASTWDLCAPHAIAIAAGGIVEYVDGTPIIYSNTNKLNGMYCMATNLVDLTKIQTEIERVNTLYPQETWVK